jgi:ELWxxDGT repeat protein/cysteine-rich repeat protein
MARRALAEVRPHFIEPFSDGTLAGSAPIITLPGANLQDLVPVGDLVAFVACDLTNTCWLFLGGTEPSPFAVEVWPLGPKPGGSNPFSLTALGGEVFFSWGELWKCTGATCGPVKEINLTGDSAPRALTRMGNHLFFVANDGSACGLWRTDGSEAGTTLVSGLGCSAQPMGELDGALILSACPPSHCGLWKTDGTPAGTVPVAVVSPMATVPTAVVDGELFFQAFDAATGIELWKTDGTAAGTVMVKDIRPASAPSNPSSLGAFNDRLLFSACTDAGCEPWISDGTAGGTVMLKDLVSQSGGSGADNLTAIGGELYFTAADVGNNHELWTSDGTPAGTAMVADIVAGDDPSYPAFLTDVGGNAFFRACGIFSGSPADCELWMSDGTAAGTVQVADVSTGVYSIFDAPPTLSGEDHLLAVDGTLYFTFNVPRCSVAQTFCIQNADCPGGQTCTNRQFLWRSDGTTAGTYQVDPSSLLFTHRNLTDVDGTLYFSSTGLWSSDGTDAGTQQVSSIDTFQIMSAGGTVFIKSCNPVGHPVSGCELWKSDGTAGGTVLVKDINPGSGSGLDPTFDTLWAAVGSTLFFEALDPTYGYELWRSDGTVAGTVMVKDIRPGSDSSSISSLTAVGGEVYFSAHGGLAEDGLWKSDGTTAGTVKVAALAPQNLTSINGNLFFTRTTSEHGEELWKSDGTAAGTVLAADVWPGSVSSEPRLITAVGSDVYFRATGASVGSEIWRLANGATCGNGVLDGSEECDDGNLVSDDGCDSDCSSTGCGNGLVTAGETCDDGNGDNDDACKNDCAPNVCGDGYLFAVLEECDDGNGSNDDGCDNNCTATGCGNGIATAGEECDTGIANGTGNCSLGCASCGNGMIGPGEQCDDGNGIETDGCANTCNVCGNGVVSGTEQCDDGNLIGGDGCEANCRFDLPSTPTPTATPTHTAPFAHTSTPTRTPTNTRTATPTATTSNCGNGTIDAGESCDDGDLVDGDGCDSNCTPTGCGNGIVTAPEACDDGNPTNGDGCETNCTTSPCTLFPATDVPRNIVDLSTTTSTLAVAASGVVTRVHVVGMHGSHTYVGDLRFRLRAPNGIEVVLFDRQCANQDNFALTLRDDAATTIPCPPTGGGSHQPATPLAGLLGVPASGNWQLFVDDMASGDTGTLSGWGLDLCTGASYCGNGSVEAGEECDDGGSANGDGCEADCTLSPTDSVVLPVSPIKLTIPAGQSSATKSLKVKVVNADLLPAPALPGHTIRLTAVTNCPGATLTAADFDPATPGEQDSVLVPGGKNKKATLRLSVANTVSPLNKKAPRRCAVTLTASNASGAADDPRPSNNTYTVAVDIFDKNDADQVASTETVIGNVKAAKVVVPDAASSAAKSVTVKVTNADIVPMTANPGHSITVTADNGTCPPGSVGVADFDNSTSGQQSSVLVKGGASKSGKLVLTVDAAAFTSGNAKSPHRCVAVLTASDAAPDADTSNDTASVTIDVYDHNDF